MRKKLIVFAALLLGLFFIGRNYAETSRILDRFETYYRPPDRLYAAAFVPFKGEIPRLFSDDDSYMHLLLLREMHESNALRQPHWTHVDNAPEGRVVFWSSLYLSWVRLVTVFRAWLTGTDFLTSLQPAASWANPLLHALLLVVLATSLPRRIGADATAFLLLSAATAPHLLMADFAPYNVDHQSLHFLAFFGSLLMLVLGGAGWVSNEADRSARTHFCFLLSGALAAVGVWVGAARQDIAWIAIGVGIFSAMLLPSPRSSTGHGKDKVAWRYDPQLWRVWGTSAAIVSLLGFLIEYFPNHLLRARLEVNTPLQALGLYCGGWLLAWLGELRHGVRTPLHWRRGVRVSAAAVGVALLPVLVFFGPQEWVAMRDPGIVQMSRSIAESSGLLSAQGMRALLTLGDEWGLLIVYLPLFSAPLVLSRRLPPNIRGAILLTAPSTILLAIICLTFQASWDYFLGATALAHLLATLLAVQHLFRGSAQLALARGVCALILLIQVGGNVYVVHAERSNVREGRSHPADLLEAAIEREVAYNLALADPAGPRNFMSAPMLGVRLAYFGQGTATSTMYENVPGINASLDFFSDTGGLSVAREIARQRGITHVIVNPSKAFMNTSVRIPQPRLPGVAGLTLGERLSLPAPVIPEWLEMIPWPYLFQEYPMQLRVFRVRH